jgi:hypothetical protein
MLLSTGLDSQVATKLLLAQGLDILLITFLNPFTQHSHDFHERARRTADTLGAPIRLEPMGKEYLDIIREPEHGYGSALNPCIDCRIYQLRHAKEIMTELGAEFLATGEVLGQRPMSQKRQPLLHVEKEADVQRLVVRPLCALLLEPSLAEESGLVDRTQLLDISGRSRNRQMKLAEEFGIHSYPTPAGGCLLTDTNFSKRLTDLLCYDSFDLAGIELLKLGRHFRPTPLTRIVLGRNEQENARLRQLVQPQDILLEPFDFVGPDGLIRGQDTPDARTTAVRLALKYSKSTSGTCRLLRDGGELEKLSLEALPDDEVQDLLIGA